MGRDERRLSKRKFTVNERVLLHLKESGSSSHAVDVPAPMTQAGIATAIGIRVNHVSRAVKSLQKKGFVREATARVKGEIKRKKIYLITEDGMAVANKVFNRVASTIVSIRDARQRIRDIPASDARGLMPPPRTYTIMINNLNDQGVLDIYKAKAKVKRTAKVSHIVNAPEDTHFYNRVEELKNLQSWYQAKTPPVMAITGNPGIGKTSLAKQITTIIKGKRPLFWLTFSDDIRVESFFESIAKFFKELGRPDFDVATKTNGFDTGTIRSSLDVCLMDVNGVIVLDGIGPEQDDIGKLSRIIIDVCIATGNLILLTARELPEWKRVLRTQGLLTEMALRGLDKDFCRKLAPNMNEYEFLKSYNLTRGNPFEVKLLAEHADDEEESMDLDPEERALLRYLRVIHEPQVK